MQERRKILVKSFTDFPDDPFSVSKLSGSAVKDDLSLLADSLNSIALMGDVRLVFLSGLGSDMATAVKKNVDHHAFF